MKYTRTIYKRWLIGSLFPTQTHPIYIRGRDTHRANYTYHPYKYFGYKKVSHVSHSPQTPDMTGFDLAPLGAPLTLLSKLTGAVEVIP